MNLRAVKGMNDILPEEMGRWAHVERIFRRTLELSAFREVRTPIVEDTSLFVRSMGEVTEKTPMLEPPAEGLIMARVS